MSRKSKRRQGPGGAHPYQRHEQPVAPPPVSSEPLRSTTPAPTQVAARQALTAPRPIITRDQLRASLAYSAVGKASEQAWAKEFRTQVHTLGANILRSGLCVAVTFVQRGANATNANQAKAAEHLLASLAKADLPGLEPDLSGVDLGAKIRELELDDYMLASREAIAVVNWLERASQALIKKPSGGDDA